MSNSNTTAPVSPLSPNTEAQTYISKSILNHLQIGHHPQQHQQSKQSMNALLMNSMYPQLVSSADAAVVSHANMHQGHPIRAPSLSPSTASSLDSSESHTPRPNSHLTPNGKAHNQHNLAIVVDSPRSGSCRSPSPAPSSASSSATNNHNNKDHHHHNNQQQHSSSSSHNSPKKNKDNSSSSGSSTTSSVSNSNNPYAPLLKNKFNCDDLAKVECHLENKELWDKFHELGTEMIITKTGR